MRALRTASPARQAEEKKGKLCTRLGYKLNHDTKKEKKKENDLPLLIKIAYSFLPCICFDVNIRFLGTSWHGSLLLLVNHLTGSARHTAA